MQRGLWLAFGRNVALLFQVRHDFRRLLRRDGPLFFNRVRVGHSGEQAELQDAEFQAGFVLDFLLQRGRELRETLVGHDVQQIDVLVLNTFAVVVHA